MFYFSVQVLSGSKVTFLQHIVNHALQTHGTSVIGTVYAANAVLMQFRHFFRQNSSATATKNTDVFTAFLLEQIVHKFEVFHVTTLVAGHGNGIGIFLNGAIHYFFSTAVVPQVNNLSTAGLYNSAHDVDGCIVAVKQTCCSYYPYFVFRSIFYYCFHIDKSLIMADKFTPFTRFCPVN